MLAFQICRRPGKNSPRAASVPRKAARGKKVGGQCAPAISKPGAAPWEGKPSRVEGFWGWSGDSAEGCHQDCVLRTPRPQDRGWPHPLQTSQGYHPRENRILLFKPNVWAHLHPLAMLHPSSPCLRPKPQHVDRVNDQLYYNVRNLWPKPNPAKQGTGQRPQRRVS